MIESAYTFKINPHWGIIPGSLNLKKRRFSISPESFKT